MGGQQPAPKGSAHANNLVIVHRRSVGNDYLIAFAQAVDDFDRAYRTSTQVDGRAPRFLSIRTQTKHTDGLLSLSEGRPPDVQNIFETFQFDGAVNAQVRTRA